MLNEKEEFLAYTGKIDYKTADKHTYLGRFNFDMLTKFIGLTRVLTIVARGYMFENGEAVLTVQGRHFVRGAVCRIKKLTNRRRKVRAKRISGIYTSSFRSLLTARVTDGFIPLCKTRLSLLKTIQIRYQNMTRKSRIS